MNKLIILIPLTVLLLIGMTTALSFSQVWEKQAEGLAYQWGVIDAVDSNIAVAHALDKTTGQPSIFRTLDGGKNWQAFPWNDWGIIDISITDSLNFWAITYKNIYHSSTGGRSWELQYNGDSTTNFMNYIEMFDSLNGVAMGDALPQHPILILKTTDGGKNWISQNNNYFINGFCLNVWRCVQFVSPDIGYGLFSYSGVPLDTIFLHKTIDGGRTWKPTSLSAKNFTLIRFFDESIGLAVREGDHPIYRTVDGGDTWTSHSMNINKGWPNDIEFFPNDLSKVLAVFSNYLGWHLGNHLLFSSDTGKTWVELLTPDIRAFRDIKMVDDKHGWIVGDQGIIYTSTGAVVTQVNNTKLNGHHDFALSQNFPNPFNSITEIPFNLTKSAVVNLEIYDLVGKKIATLLNNQLLQAGFHSINLNANEMASGIYFYRLTTSQNRATKRMIILK